MELFEEFLEETRHDVTSKKKDERLSIVVDAWKDKHCKSNDERDWVDHILDVNITSDYGADPYTLSNWYFDMDDEISGDDLLCKQGYCKVIDYFARNLDIRLNTIVDTINYSPEPGSNIAVSIATKNGDLYSAEKAVIVTLPLVI